MLNTLTPAQLSAMHAGLKAGYLEKTHGLVKLKLVGKRVLYDGIRHRAIETGDYVLTRWGEQVATHFMFKVGRLPIGTCINHRIAAYRNGTVVLADDSGSLFSVDASAKLRVHPGAHEGVWDIPLKDGSYTPSTARLGWHLRNFLGMDVELDLSHGASVNDFSF